MQLKWPSRTELTIAATIGAFFPFVALDWTPGLNAALSGQVWGMQIIAAVAISGTLGGIIVDLMFSMVGPGLMLLMMIGACLAIGVLSQPIAYDEDGGGIRVLIVGVAAALLVFGVALLIEIGRALARRIRRA